MGHIWELVLKTKKNLTRKGHNMQYPERGKVERMLGYKDLEILLGVHRRTITRWVDQGLFPPADKMISVTPKWLESTVAAWQQKGKTKEGVKDGESGN